MWLLLALAGCPAVDDTGNKNDDTGETGDSSAETGESGIDTAETGETGETAETGETGGTNINPLAEADLAGLWLVAPAPAQLTQMVMERVAVGDGIACPALVAAGYNLVVEGDCTDDAGFTWSGSAWVDGASDADHIRFDGFGMSVAGVRYEASGETWGSSSELGYAVTGDLDLTLQGYEAYGFPTSTTLRYSGAAITVDDIGNPLLIEEGMEEVGVGVLVVSAATTWDWESCTAEPVTGQAIFDGARSVTLTFDGADDCDGCFAWTASDATSGEVCAP